MLIYFLPLLYFQVVYVHAQTSYGCEIGWKLFGNYCYRAVDINSPNVNTLPVTFLTARDYCLSNGADLVSLHSAFENQFIQTNLSLIQNHRYWIGLQINGGPTDIYWIDGTQFTYNNLNQTTIKSGSIQAAYLTPGAQWVAQNGSMQLEGRICKRPAIPNMPARHNGSALGSTFAHDPTLLKTLDGQYIVYATGFNIPATISNDEKTFSKNGTALPMGMSWTLPWTTGKLCFGNVTNTSNSTYSCIWSPDVHEINGKYYMYYSASSPLSINSAIGMATSSTGRPGDWMDRGLVFNSSSSVNWNAIDPALFVDDDGRWYVIFGSRYSGIFQYEMDPSTGFVKAGAQAIQLANDRQWGIEGPAFFKKDSYYYLFACIGYCCQGTNSTYITIIGRSTSPQGPFVDKAGNSLLNGGGSELLVPEFPILGPGGPYIFADTDHDLITYHYYDGLNNGEPRLSINYLGWTDDGWPYMY